MGCIGLCLDAGADVEGSAAHRQLAVHVKDYMTVSDAPVRPLATIQPVQCSLGSPRMRWRHIDADLACCSQYTVLELHAAYAVPCSC